MLNGGVSKNVVYGYSCRYTQFYHTKIATTLAKTLARSLLVKDNTAERNVPQEKRNYHETVHDCTKGTKEITF